MGAQQRRLLRHRSTPLLEHRRGVEDLSVCLHDVVRAWRWGLLPCEAHRVDICSTTVHRPCRIRAIHDKRYQGHYNTKQQPPRNIRPLSIAPLLLDGVDQLNMWRRWSISFISDMYRSILTPPAAKRMNRTWTACEQHMDSSTRASQTAIRHTHNCRAEPNRSQ